MTPLPKQHSRTYIDLALFALSTIVLSRIYQSDLPNWIRTGTGATALVLGIVFYFKVFLRSDTLAIGLIFFMAMTQGVFYYIGLPRAFPVLITEGSILAFFLKSVHIDRSTERNWVVVYGFFPLLGMLTIFIISYLWNRPDLLAALYCARQMFILFLFYLALHFTELSESAVKKINSFITLMVLVQLPVACLKLFVYGQNEFWVGTISSHAGSLATTFPLFIIVFLTARFYFNQKILSILLIFCFLGFGIVSMKRAIAFYIPIVMGVVWIVYEILEGRHHFDRSKRRLKNFLLIVFLGVAGLFIASKMIFTLNPQLQQGGRFDLNFIFMDRILGYNLRTMELENDVPPDEPLILTDPQGKTQIFKCGSAMGRITLTVEALKRLKNGGIINMLIGYGPGEMIRSPHLGRSKKTPYEKFGIYGSYTGFVVYVLQIGILGVFCLVLFFLSISIKIIKTYSKFIDLHHKILAIGLLGATFVCLLDFFTYSQTTLNQHALFPLYLYAAVLCLKKYPADFSLRYLFHFSNQ